MTTIITTQRYFRLARAKNNLRMETVFCYESACICMQTIKSRNFKFVWIETQREKAHENHQQ